MFCHNISIKAWERIGGLSQTWINTFMCQRGMSQVARINICRHQIKVLMFLRPHLVEGTIAWYYDSLRGIWNGVLSTMLNPCPIPMPSPQ
jgi:hypothetical protein